MKNIEKVKKAITHKGKFHTDDVLSTVLLKELNPNIEIERVETYQTDDSVEEILVFDIGMGEFDHHEENREINDFGYPYSAFGKLWRAYGKQLLEKYGFKKVDKAYKRFNQLYVSKVDQGDNTGYKQVTCFQENTMIIKFNPLWFEKKNNPQIEDEQFNKAVEFAAQLFRNWLRFLYEEIELNEIEDEIWNNAIEKEDNGIIVLEERIPWPLYVKRKEYNYIKLIISKNDRGAYSVTSKNSEEIQIKESEFLTFVHPSGFMGVANTLENAVNAAKISLGVC